MGERLAEIESHGRDAMALFGISEADFNEVVAFSKRRMSDSLGSEDVAPDKEALLSLARGLSDAGALREMVDNALDCSQRKRDGAPIEVRIELNSAKGFVRVSDDAGGMSREEMLRCLKLGARAPGGDVENVIGKFGVGAKEAIYHFGREVTITSRDLESEEGIETYVPPTWLDQRDWTIQLFAVEAPRGTTVFQIGVLHDFDFNRTQIEAELWETYRKRINSGRLKLFVNGELLVGAPDPVLLYPPELYPRRYNFMVSNVMVDLDVAILRDDPAESGIFFYTFGRLFAHWGWTDTLTRTIFEKPNQHKLNTHFRVDIDFQGKIDDIPINSNKDQVEISRYMFKPFSKVVSKIVQPYLGIVSWLSKDKNMGYIDQFAGRENAHPLVAGSPGLDSKIELGKVFDSMSLAKPQLADQARMFEIIAKERAAEVKVPELAPEDAKEVPLATTHRNGNTVGVGGTLPVAKDQKRPEGAASQPTLDLPQSATLMVSLLVADSSQIDRLRKEIEMLAERLGVAIKVS